MSTSLKQAIKKLYAERKTALAQFRFGHPKIKAQFKTLDEIKAHYDTKIQAAEKEFEQALQGNVQAVEEITDTIASASPVEPIVESSPSIQLPPNSARQKPKLRNWQQAACDWTLEKILSKKSDAALLGSPVRTGKTFMVGNIVTRLWDIGWPRENCFSPWPILVLTKANVVIQFERKMELLFGLNPVSEIKVTNYDQLRAGFGRDVLNEEYKVIGHDAEGNPVEVVEYEWVPYMNPKLIICDERHSLKNEDSKQSRILQAVAKLPKGSCFLLEMSATLGTRVADFKTFACNLKCDVDLE